MSDAIKEKVEALIQENPVMVFSKSYCPYCRSTKGTLRSFDAKFKVLELDEVGMLATALTTRILLDVLQDG